ncbi:MAG: hypothetical protein MI743_20065 [Sneathiellales bacterium]|nr:hypothetical protein [Sneathiellales bacterium]
MKAAFLSSSLISPKGSAGPATKTSLPGELLAKSRRAEKIYKGEKPKQQNQQIRPDIQAQPSERPTTAQPASSSVVEQPARAHKVLNEQPVDTDIIAQTTQNMRRDKFGRVRMSIRMTPEQHLNLKLISAHSRKSAQVIMEEALSEYVSRHGDALIPGACVCVQDKILK